MIEYIQTKLIRSTVMHFSEILTWVNSREDLLEWAGQNMQCPASRETLIADLSSNGWPSFSLVSIDKELLAFGQYCLRLDRCHLCRLIVSPLHRGEGVVQALIEMLSIEGTKELGVTSCSLFVYADNLSAVRAYQKAGFVEANYPSEDIIENCLYMHKNQEASALKLGG